MPLPFGLGGCGGCRLCARCGLTAAATGGSTHLLSKRNEQCVSGLSRPEGINGVTVALSPWFEGWLKLNTSRSGLRGLGRDFGEEPLNTKLDTCNMALTLNGA
jgi:hypothetical protein